MQKKNHARKREKQPAFIRCANGNYPILTHGEIVEKLASIKRGVRYYDYSEFLKHLKKVVNGIIETKCLNESESLRYFTQMRKSMDYVVKDNRLRAEWKDIEVYPEMLSSVIETLIDFLSNHDDLKRLFRCEKCKNFFLRTRNDERERFCSDACRDLFKQDSRKTNDGKKKRADYMVSYRANLKKRKLKKKRDERLKRLIDGGHSRKEAEKFLEDTDA